MYRWGARWCVSHVRSCVRVGSVLVCESCVQVGSVLVCESCEVMCTGGERVGV